MTTSTIITNGTVSFAYNADISKAEMFKQAVEQGFEGGKTSFMNLLNGKATEVKGFRIETVEIKQEVAADAADFQPTLVLNTLATETGFEVKVKEASTETYGTVVGHYGRAQLNPLKAGGYSILFFPKKGWHETELQALLNEGEIKSLYLKLGKKSEADTRALLKKLSQPIA